VTHLEVVPGPLRVLVLSRYQFARAGLGSLVRSYPDRATVLEDDSRRVGTSADVALYDLVGPTFDDTVKDVQWLLASHTPIVGFTRSNVRELGEVARSRGLVAATVPEDVSPVQLIDTLEATVEERRARIERHRTTLTRQELVILRRIGTGATNAQIAADLSISRNTLKSHIRSAYHKVGISRRVEAVRWAATQGHVDW
jgi:two-component system, NarL family, response regulator LiaR